LRRYEHCPQSHTEADTCTITNTIGQSQLEGAVDHPTTQEESFRLSMFAAKARPRYCGMPFMEKIFTAPDNKRTEQYITGRFG